jgi:hypothetical protein
LKKAETLLEKLSKRLKISLFIIGFALLWCILWTLFPMEFYAFFLSDIIGSNIYILMICIAVAFLTQTLFGALWKLDFKLCLPTIIAAIFQLTTVYVYSIFFYSNYPFVILIAIAVSAIVNLIIIAKTRNKDPEIKLSLIKRKPIMAVCYALILSFTGNFLTLMLFVMSKNAFIDSMGRG